ncbi:MAG: DNA-methyltransferase [Phycisphaerales bacterium JB038]
MRKLPDESVDLVVTDPPYNIASKGRKTIQKGKLVSTMEAWGAWDTRSQLDHDILILQTLSESYRILKPGGAVYMFLAEQDVGYFARKAVQRGFTYRSMIAMIKPTPLPSFYKNCWRSSFDLCMYLTKGRTKAFNFLTQAEMVNNFSYSIRGKRSTHPTEKPLGLIRKFVQVSSNPGDLVVDPFMGSGTTAVACAQLGRRCIGFDTCPEYIEMAKGRLRNEGSPDTSTEAGTAA